MRSQTTCFYFLALLSYKAGLIESKASQQLDVDEVNEIKDEVLERVVTPDDNFMQVQVKSKLVDFLVDTTIEDYQQKHPRPRQEEAEGAAEGAEVPENQDVINGVRRILQNVFTGNLVGVIQESVSIRSPGVVQTFFADIMGAFFGSNAVKGAGTIGLPQPTNATTALNATDPALAGTEIGTAALPNNKASTTSSISENGEDEDENDELYKE